MSRPEVAVSIDIETDGPAPGLNSMLSLGAAAFNQSGEHVSNWYKKFIQLPDASPNVETMKWWDTQPAAYVEVCSNLTDPAETIPQFVSWCKSLPGKPIAVAWPAAFDFAFVNYYCWRFAGENPLGFACEDIRSYANGLAKYPMYYGIGEKAIKSMAGEVDTSDLQDHVAIDDAIGQGRLLMALRRNTR